MNADERRLKTRVLSAFICVHRRLILFAFVFSLSAQQPADWVWSARYVITEDPRHTAIENGAVAIRGERILAVDTKAAIDARFRAAQRLDRPDAILAPG